MIWLTPDWALAFASSSRNSSKWDNIETRGGVMMQRECVTFRANRNTKNSNNAISKQAHGKYIMHTKSKAVSRFT